VDINLPFNTIIGRLTLYQYMAITHYDYLMMKILTPNNVTIILNDRNAGVVTVQKLYIVVVALDAYEEEAWWWEGFQHKCLLSGVRGCLWPYPIMIGIQCHCPPRTRPQWFFPVLRALGYDCRGPRYMPNQVVRRIYSGQTSGAILSVHAYRDEREDQIILASNSF
jgi:hypothetical protein